MQLNKLYRLIIIHALLLSSFCGFSQSVLPTDTSPVGFDVAPIGWTIIFGSTDVSDQDLWGGVSAWYAPVDDPPNGDTVWVTGIYNETVGTTISDLVIGVDYTLEFYMAELGQSDWALLVDGTLKVDVGDITYLFPFTGGFDFSWSLQTINFTATATSMLMSFEYETYSAHCWNVSFGSEVEITCDTLDTYVSAIDICLGEEVTLSAESTNDGIVAWDGGVTDGVAFAPPLGTTLYTATSDFEDDCDFGIEITVNESPIFDLSVDDAEICEGESITFTVDGDADVFEWNIPDIEPGEPFIPDIGTDDYILTGTNGVCEHVETIEITVHENPNVEGFVDVAEICIGESFVFTGEGADVYIWDVGVIDGEPYTPLIPGVSAHFVYGTDTVTGCESYDYLYVNVHALPAVVANADDESVCEGDLVTLTGSGASSFEWDLGVMDGVPFEPPLGTTTYTITGTSIYGCENTATIEISVYEYPDVTALADDTEICEGDEIILTGDGADSYTWDLGAMDGIAIIPDGTGTFTYTVIGTDDSGCEGTATIDILVHPNPSITATVSPTEICEGESAIFTGSGADTYVWDDGITDGIAFIPAETGDVEYFVVGTDTETGCSNTTSVIINVIENPTVTASASFMEVCLGESTTLTGSGAESYVWDGGIIDGVSYTPASLGAIEYTVTGINEFGCEGTATIIISVLECEPVIAGFELPNSICINDCISIQDTSVGEVISWAWEFGPGIEPSTSTVQNPIICTNNPGVFTIILTTTSATGAISTHSEDLIVYENPIIEVGHDTIIDLGGTATLFANSPSAGEYTWTPFNEVDCPECPIITTSPTQTQLYIVNLIDENGCRASDSALVMVNLLLSVGVPTAFSPNNDGNNDVLFVKGLALESIYFAVYNRYGELIFETTDQRIGWDGTHLNKDENPGVFTWVLDYTTEEGKKGKLQGNTTLIR